MLNQEIKVLSASVSGLSILNPKADNVMLSKGRVPKRYHTNIFYRCQGSEYPPKYTRPGKSKSQIQMEVV
jgi:hypothetical protein